MLLTKENAPQVRGLPGYRFVRWGIDVLISRGGHRDIADLKPNQDPNDAGFIGSMKDEVYVFGRSDTLNVGKQDSPERRVTIDLVRPIIEASGRHVR